MSFLFASPDSPHAKLVELRVGAEDGDVLAEGLGCDHAVEGVAMRGDQAAGAEGGFRINVQDGVTSVLHHVEVCGLEFFRTGELAEADLCGDLPGGGS